MKVHLDTDFGGDPDDACALALLLASPGAEIVGITTNLDPGGRRAGCVAHYLKLAGRSDIPVAAGAGATLTGLDAITRPRTTLDTGHSRLSRCLLRPELRSICSGGVWSAFP